MKRLTLILLLLTSAIVSGQCSLDSLEVKKTYQYLVHREYLKKENDLLHDIVNTKNLQIGILNDKLILFDDKIKSDDIVIGNQLIIIGNKDKEIQIYTDKLNKEKAKKVNNFVYGGVAGILLTLILTR